MKALSYQGAWDLKLVDREEPQVKNADDVVVQVAATGICGTDIGIATGQYNANKGVILGHEFSGKIVAAGKDVTHVKVGDRVFVDPTYHCGHCRMCNTGRTNHCSEKDGTEAGVSKDGAFTSHYITSSRFVYALSDKTPYEAATLAEPLSCALTGVNQVAVRPDDQAVVIGGGPMGILYAHALALKGVIGSVVEIAEKRKQLVENALPPAWDCVQTLDEVTRRFPDGKLDLAVDTSGVLLGPLMEKINRGGRILLVGLKKNPTVVDQYLLADRSISVVGSIDSLGTFPIACKIIDQGRLPWQKIVTGSFPVSQFKEAFQELGVDLAQKSYRPVARQIKVLLTPEGAR